MDTNQIDAACLQSLCELEAVWADMETCHGEYLGDSFWNISQAILAGRRSEKIVSLKVTQISALNEMCHQQKIELVALDLKLQAYISDNHALNKEQAASVSLKTYQNVLTQLATARDVAQRVEAESQTLLDRVHVLEGIISKMPADSPPEAN